MLNKLHAEQALLTAVKTNNFGTRSRLNVCCRTVSTLESAINRGRTLLAALGSKVAVWALGKPPLADTVHDGGPASAVATKAHAFSKWIHRVVCGVGVGTGVGGGNARVVGGGREGGGKARGSRGGVADGMSQRKCAGVNACEGRVEVASIDVYEGVRAETTRA